MGCTDNHFLRWQVLRMRAWRSSSGFAVSVANSSWFSSLGQLAAVDGPERADEGLGAAWPISWSAQRVFCAGTCRGWLPTSAGSEDHRSCQTSGHRPNVDQSARHSGLGEGYVPGGAALEPACEVLALHRRECPEHRLVDAVGVVVGLEHERRAVRGEVRTTRPSSR